jgi:cytoskeletal protein RodZ
VGTFGEKFRKERERRGFSLDDVSNVTKIGARMLKAIEDEHFDKLPGGVFNKGFIRAYARHLGLNDEEAVTEYLAALREAQVEAQNSSAPASPPPARKTADASPAKSNAAQVYRPAVKPATAPPKAQPKAEIAGDARAELPELQLPKAEHIRTRPPAGNGTIPWTVPALVVLLVLIGILLWSRHSRNARAAPENTTQATTSNSVSSPSATTGNDSSSPRSRETPATATGSAASAQQPALAPPVSRASTSESDPAGTNDVTVRNSKPRDSAAPTPEAAPGLKLVIRATENSWISVIADGQQVNQETLIAPAHTSTRASREIIVKVGNAAGVSFLLNGKEFSAQGNEAEVKTFVFDNTGMRTVASGQGEVPAGDTSNR